MELAETGNPSGRGRLMGRVTNVHTIDEVARRIGENLELIELVSANSDNIDYGEMIWVDNGTEEETVRNSVPWRINYAIGKRSSNMMASWPVSMPTRSRSSARSVNQSDTILQPKRLGMGRSDYAKWCSRRWPIKSGRCVVSEAAPDG